MANEEHLKILRRGVEIWNRWRAANPNLIPDLSGNISHVAYSREAKIQGIDVSGKDWVNGSTQLSLRKKLRGVNLREATLFGAILNNADLRDADLTDANLSGTLINGADLTRANLTNANLSGADIEFTDFTDTILTNTKFARVKFRSSIHVFSGKNDEIRDLLQPRDFTLKSIIGKANLSQADLENFDLSNVCLRGVMLVGANLVHINLSNADLSGSNLTNADLTRAEVLGTNFTEARLTGICLEHWNTNATTNLSNVICEYVYYKQGDQDRLPSDPNQNFASGEFTKLFQEVHNTFDLISHNGMNWRAFALAFTETNTEVIDEYGGELFLRGYEILGDGLVRLKIEYPEGADKGKVKVLLEEKHELQIQNSKLEGKVEAYERMLFLPRIVQIGDNNSVDNRTINTGGGNYNESIGGNYIQGNYINLSQDLTQAAAQIQDLLTQLQTQGATVETAQQKVAIDLANEAKANPTVMGKLVGWGQVLAQEASKKTVGDVVAGTVKLGLRAAGLPLP